MERSQDLISQDLMRVQFDVGLVEALTQLKDIVLMPTPMPTGPTLPDIWRMSSLSAKG